MLFQTKDYLLSNIPGCKGHRGRIRALTSHSLQESDRLHESTANTTRLHVIKC